jgi:hypothetical protein
VISAVLAGLFSDDTLRWLHKNRLEWGDRGSVEAIAAGVTRGRSARRCIVRLAL